MTDAKQRTCLVCGKELPKPTTRGRPPVVCGEECKKAQAANRCAKMRAETHAAPLVPVAIEATPVEIAKIQQAETEAPAPTAVLGTNGNDPERKPTDATQPDEEPEVNDRIQALKNQTTEGHCIICDDKITQPARGRRRTVNCGAVECKKVYQLESWIGSLEKQLHDAAVDAGKAKGLRMMARTVKPVPPMVRKAGVKLVALNSREATA